MENPIKKVFENKIDDKVHDEFVKFGKGNFEDRYNIEVKKQKDGKFKISTSAEFSNFLIEKCLNKVDEKIRIRGIIISTYDIEEDIKFPLKDKKKYMGMIKYVIDTETSKNKLQELIEKNPRVFYGLSFSSPNFDLKIKEKSPRSAKPGKKKGKKKTGFCKLKTRDKELVKDLLFDISSFNEVSISHDIIVNNIKYPENIKELMKEKSPKQIREMAKRQGKVIRKIDVGGRKKKKEKEFII